MKGRNERKHEKKKINIEKGNILKLYVKTNIAISIMIRAYYSSIMLKKMGQWKKWGKKMLINSVIIWISIIQKERISVIQKRISIIQKTRSFIQKNTKHYTKRNIKHYTKNTKRYTKKNKLYKKY